MPTGQTLSQEPQREGSALRSTQALPQRVSGGLHVKPHFPWLQVGVPPATFGHGSAHPPQFSGSPFGSMHAVPHGR
jgi:hypothetical protein